MGLGGTWFAHREEAHGLLGLEGLGFSTLGPAAGAADIPKCSPHYPARTLSSGRLCEEYRGPGVRGAVKVTPSACACLLTCEMGGHSVVTRAEGSIQGALGGERGCATFRRTEGASMDPVSRGSRPGCYPQLHAGSAHGPPTAPAKRSLWNAARSNERCTGS